MPRIRLIDPWGQGYEIATRRPDTLRAWFGEILPHANADFGKRDVPPARINVWPMWWRSDGKDADWLTDSRMIGRLDPFPARNGDEGMAALEKLRRELTGELARLKAAQGR